jgi:presenilin-like A22 family membrane protease
MKHNVKITIILLAMFLLTQFIGLYVVNHYSSTKVVNGEAIEVDAPNLPYGMDTPEIEKPEESGMVFVSILFAFIFAITILFFLTKFKAEIILKAWFFIVICVALGIFFWIFTNKLGIEKMLFGLPVIASLIALILAYFKVFKRNLIVHNLTELLIYPAIAVVFVPLLKVKGAVGFIPKIWPIIALLIIISLYDMWAVWKSGLMQKMAKFQIDKMKIFSGFFIPYLSKKERMKLRKAKKAGIKDKKVKANVAILGGGDVIFPIITAGVMLTTFGFLSALFVILGAALGLSYLFFFADTKKFYPAMPYITGGMFLGILASWLII